MEIGTDQVMERQEKEACLGDNGWLERSALLVMTREK